MWICDSLHLEYFWKLDLPSMSKRIYPTFSETFLGDSAKRKVLSMDHSRLTPTPFFGKRVITKSLLWTKKKIFIFSCTHFQEFTRRLVLMARSCETWNRPIFIRATHRKFTQVQVIFFLLLFVLTRFYRVRCVSSFSRRTNNLPREEENFPKKEGTRKGRTGNQMFYLSLMDRRGSRINSYRFHKRAPKAQASRAGVSGACSSGKIFGFKVPKVPFPGFLNHSDRIFTVCLNHFLDFNFYYCYYYYYYY